MNMEFWNGVIVGCLVGAVIVFFSFMISEIRTETKQADQNAKVISNKTRRRLKKDKLLYDEGFHDGKRDALKWTSVKERLPEKDGDYLVWYLIEDGDPCIGILPFDSNVPGFGYWDEYYDPVTYGCAGSDFIEVREVTHWMPMPEPPKEMKGEEK